MTAGTVVVRGHGAVPGQPDEFQVSLALSAVAKSAAEALAEAGRLSRELERVLCEMEVPASARSAAGLSVREEFDRLEGRWVRRGYRASNRVVVRLEEPGRLGRLMSEAAARAGARVEGPRWRFRPENAARAEACRQAAADARRKAEAYAGALGVRLGPVLRVAEPCADGDGTAPAALLREGTAPTDMQIGSGHLDVTATVEVTFQLLP